LLKNAGKCAVCRQRLKTNEMRRKTDFFVVCNQRKKSKQKVPLLILTGQTVNLLLKQCGRVFELLSASPILGQRSKINL